MLVENIGLIFSFLPALTCFFWAVMPSAHTQDKRRYWITALMALLMGLGLFAESVLAHLEPVYWLAPWLDLMERIWLMSFFPLLYFSVVRSHPLRTPRYLPLTLFSAVLMLISMQFAVIIVLGLPDASTLICGYHEAGLLSLLDEGRKATGFLFILFLLDFIVFISGFALCLFYLPRRTRPFATFYILSVVLLIVWLAIPGRSLEAMPLLSIACNLLLSALLYRVFAYSFFACGSIEVLARSLVDTEEESSKAQADVPRELLDRFETYVNEQKPYLNPAFCIEDVVKAIGTNRTYVSALINKSYGVSFRMYINLLRVEHAKRMMADNPRALLAEVAEASGFAGVSQFVRKFRELTGEPPKSWSAANLSKPIDEDLEA